MKLMASGVAYSAARVRSPSFSRSSSSTTTTMRLARISAKAPGTSVKGGSNVRRVGGMTVTCILAEIGSRQQKRRPRAALFPLESEEQNYNVDSISNPQASSKASGMYFEFLFRRAHSRRRVDRMYWSGLSLNSLTICSKEVTVGTTGPIGPGLPQFGFPRRFAIGLLSSWWCDFLLRASCCLGNGTRGRLSLQ